ncbi:hypothetical protein Taro_013617 [Colocasia esculenta]|uniref:UBX domain-containing protein n=1 Tax=Colocasia esculenta TaxID=4460 RepID=A0A843UCE1_COLES|nr:hypothetical protein [Colocasia esculenta]
MLSGGKADVLRKTPVPLPRASPETIVDYICTYKSRARGLKEKPKKSRKPRNFYILRLSTPPASRSEAGEGNAFSPEELGIRMARPTQDAIETFMSVTGASEAVALQKLEEHGGDLNEAVNAHFSEGERINSHTTSIPAAHDDVMDIDEPVNIEAGGPPFPMLSASRSFNPFSLLDDHLGRSYFDRRDTADIRSNAPRVSHPRERREIPIEFKDGDGQSGSSSHGPTIEDITGNDAAVGPEIFGHVSVDDNDDDLVEVNARASGQTERQYEHLYGTIPEPSAPQVAVMNDNNDIEEEMIKAAIEASKHDAERYSSLQFSAPNMEEREKGPANPLVVDLDEKTSLTANGRQEVGASNSGTSRQLLSKDGNSFLEDEEEDAEEQPLIRQHSRHISSEASNSRKEVVELDDSSPSGPRTNEIGPQPLHNGDAFHSSEWGGISSEEHDEAVMLEAAMFGGIPERAAYSFSYPNHEEAQMGSGRHTSFYPWIPRPPSPGLTAQRLLREQQDDEYLAALQADKEKELKALQEAELRRLEEVAAREAALQEEKHQEEEARKKLLEEEEFERDLAAKQASLPTEPSPDDENAVTLLVRMPDGSRRGRRFLKSDRLQSLFDFIDIGRVVKPRTYKLVRPYPRRAFSDGDSNLTLNDLGLASKQEALFLELI